MTGHRSDRATPNLPSSDLDATEEFYAALGFDRAFRDDGWMILRRGGLQVEFFPDPGVDPLTTAAGCCLRVVEVDELYRAARRAGIPEGTVGAPRLHPVVMQEWGMRAGALVDRDGNLLRLIEER